MKEDGEVTTGDIRGLGYVSGNPAGEINTYSVLNATDADTKDQILRKLLDKMHHQYHDKVVRNMTRGSNLMDELSEVDLRTDITKKATGFANKKFLNKPIADIQSKFNRTARRKLKHHSTMEDGRHVYHGIDDDGHHHFMTVDNSGHVDSSVTAIKRGKSHNIDMAVAKPGAGVHKLYHHLITKHNHIITSNSQSGGGLRIWQNMRKMGGVNVHGYHKKSGKPVHIDIVRHPEESHVSRKELEKMRRDKGGTRDVKKKEYAATKKQMAMHLVAHKNKNILPMKNVKENASSTVLRVIRESLEK